MEIKKKWWKEKEFDGSLEKKIAFSGKNLNFFSWILNNPPIFPFNIRYRWFWQHLHRIWIKVWRCDLIFLDKVLPLEILSIILERFQLKLWPTFEFKAFITTTKFFKFHAVSKIWLHTCDFLLSINCLLMGSLKPFLKKPTLEVTNTLDMSVDSIPHVLFFNAARWFPWRGRNNTAYSILLDMWKDACNILESIFKLLA